MQEIVVTAEQGERIEDRVQMSQIEVPIKQIQKFFGRVEDSMNVMVELSKNVAVQSEIIENTKKKGSFIIMLLDR